MTSPASDVIAKRRYRKHRKVKKKNTSKEAIGDVIPPPKITKRLTSGFCFKGAVITSSHSRNNKGGGPLKARKTSNDYDLHCLLKAAKSKISAIDHSSTDGISSTEEIGTEFNDNGQIDQDQNESYNYKHKPTKSPAFLKEIDINTRSSFENRVQFRNKGHNSEGAIEFEKVPMIKQQNISDKEGHLPSNDQHSIDLNSSRENSITHSIPKPHVSSYQKFAVGVVEALVAEKKKQFPNLGLSKQIKLELNNIYQQRKIAIDMTKKAPSTCLPPENNSELCIAKSKCLQAPASPIEIQLMPPINTQGMEEKTFKERNVEAWLEAIPEASADKTEKLDKHKDTNHKCARSYEQFERVFLENVRRDQTAFKHTNPFVLKEERSPFWIIDGVKSPSFSPFLTKEKKALLELATPQESEEAHKNKSNQIKFNFNLASEKGQGYQHFTGVPQQSQTLWSIGENNNLQQKLTDSSICPSPLFSFDPPGYKRTWIATKDDFGSKDTKLFAKDVEDKHSVWSQFPKLPKKDERQVSNYRGFHDKQETTLMYNQNRANIQKYADPIVYERSLKNKKSESPAYIKFSPRKMF